MLPVVDKPLIQYAVEEAAAAGITEMIFVTGRNKRAIEDHFDKAYELETELERKNKDVLLDMVRSVLPEGVSCIYIRQAEPLGLGHAVLCAQPVVGNEPFAVLLADDLIDAEPPAMCRMAEIFAQRGRLAARRGGSAARPDRRATASSTIDKMRGRHRAHPQHRREAQAGRGAVEPRVVGRYVLTPRIFEHAGEGDAGRGRRDPAHRRHLARCSRTSACSRCACRGRRYDCGSKLGYLQATRRVRPAAPRDRRGVRALPEVARDENA